MLPARHVVLLMLVVSCSGSAPSPRGTGGSGEDEGTGGQAEGGRGGAAAGTGGRAATGTGGEATGGAIATGGTGPDAAADSAVASPDASPTPDSSPAMPPPAPGDCTLKWSPSAAKDGNNGFEGLEMPDNRGTHGGVHFSTVAEHDAYRVDQHYDPPGAVDLDNHPDRLRCEVKGMRVGNTNLSLLNGQRWRISWSFFLPASMLATGSFSDIFQMKYVDTGGGSSGSPIFTINLNRGSGGEKLLTQAQFAPGLGGFPAVDLAPLREKWVTNTFDFRIGAGGAGRLRWILSDGDKVLVDVEKQVPTWPSDAARLRPKWGLYRKLGDPGVKTTYMLISDLKGFQCE